MLISIFVFVSIMATTIAEEYPCGVPLRPLQTRGRSQNRIRGGSDATPHSLPWQVLFLINDPNDEDPIICGGSLINSGRSNGSDLVITAAHCFEIDEDKGTFAEPTDIVVVVGAHNFAKQESKRRTIHVSSIAIHELYDPKEVENDIALVRLKDVIPYSEETRPICLPKHRQSLPYGVTCVSSGWGQLAEHISLSAKLRMTAVRILPHDRCSAGINDRIQLCTKGKGDICDGDSGGPLACPIDVRYTLFGIASYSDDENECSNSIFTSVPSFIQWYEKITKQMVTSGTAKTEEPGKWTEQLNDFLSRVFSETPYRI